MAALRLEKQPVGQADVDLCRSCQLIWFDRFESVQLTPGSVLALFKAMHDEAPAVRQPLSSTLACPRCDRPLAVTHDRTREARFTYYRCSHGHGRLTPFFQFLREKSFVRAAPPEDIARLKALVRVIRCSSCGAAVDLERQTACAYCRAPIAVLDPDGVQKALAGLAAAEAKRTRIDPAALVQGWLVQPAARTSPGGPDPGVGIDLVMLGIAAVFADE